METSIINLPEYKSYLSNINSTFLIEIPKTNKLLKNITLVLIFNKDIETIPNAERIPQEIIKFVKLRLDNFILAYETGEQYKIQNILGANTHSKVYGNKIFIKLFSNYINLMPLLNNFISKDFPKLKISYQQTKQFEDIYLVNSILQLNYFNSNIQIISNFYLFNICKKIYLLHEKNYSIAKFNIEEINHHFSFFHVLVFTPPINESKNIICNFNDRNKNKLGEVLLKPTNKLSTINNNGFISYECLETNGNNNWIINQNEVTIQFEFQNEFRPQYCYIIITSKKKII